jgi:outer membrane protein
MNPRLLALLLIAAPAVSAEPRNLPVEDAVKRALEANPALRALRSRVEAAHDQADSVRGHYLPAFDINDEVQHYDRPFIIPFSLASFGFPGSLPFPVRQIDTNTLVISAAQPLVGLLEISQSHLAAQDNAAGLAEQLKAQEDGIAEQVRTQYLRLWEAKATEDIARSSQEELNEQLAVSKSKLAAGVLTTADVLRVEVAVANARQQEIQAKAQEEVSRATLLALLNVPPTDITVDFAEPKDLENAPAPPNLADAVQKADAQRPELAAAHYAESATSHQSLGTIFHMLPQFDFEAAYLHVTGQEFAQVNSGYAGFKLNWVFWQWGADYYAHKAAEAQALASTLDAENLRDQIGADLSAKLSIEHSSTVAVEVAQTAIDSAVEAYRVTDALVKAGSATTTDLLDAQSALTTAKLNLVRARYEQAIARVAVGRAIGT